MKPARGDADEDERKRMCNKLRRLPERHWSTSVEAYIDGKDWPIPQNVRGQRCLNMLRARGHLRAKGECLNKGFAKLDKKHRVSTGGNAKLIAAIIGARVRVWHHLPRRWCGGEAEKIHEKMLAPALERHRGPKRRRILLEDDDPTGFMLKASVDAAQQPKSASGRRGGELAVGHYRTTIGQL